MLRSLLAGLLLLLASAPAVAQETIYSQDFDDDYRGEGFTFYGGSYETGVFDSAFALDEKMYRYGGGSLRVGSFGGELRATHHLAEPLDEGNLKVWVNFSDAFDASTMVMLHTPTTDGETEMVRVAFDGDGFFRPASGLLQPHAQVTERGFTLRPGWYELTLHQSGGSLTAYVGHERVARWYCDRPWSAFSLARTGASDAVAWFDEIEVYAGEARIETPPAERSPRQAGLVLVGLGGGVGLARLSLGGVDFTNELEAAPAIHAVASYAPRPGLRWMVETTAWPTTFTVREEQFDRLFGLAALSVKWFPDDSPLFLRGGLGMSYVNDAIAIPQADEASDPDRETSTLGYAMTAGVGYDFAVSDRSMALVEFQYARLDLGEQSAVDLFSFQVGIRFALNQPDS